MKELITEAIECYQQISEKYINKEDISQLLLKLNVSLYNLKKEVEATEKPEKGKRKATDSRKVIQNSEDVNKVAYFLARYEHYDLSKQRQTPALRIIAEKLGIKFETLRNRRDYFDKFVQDEKQKANEEDEKKGKQPKLTPRFGWRDAVLNPEMETIMQECRPENKTKEQLLKEVKEILGIV